METVTVKWREPEMLPNVYDNTPQHKNKTQFSQRFYGKKFQQISSTKTIRYELI